mmetsp:Transcript_37591/g.68696  ORF Transcript_37591/g.68696 Transcript_37591/m.68696 type:complete len:102 (+) Transcript_37591:185-490(+)
MKLITELTLPLFSRCSTLFQYDVAVQTVTQVLDLMQKSKLVLQKVMDPAENELENLRLKSDNYEMIVSQHGNFTMIVNQSFKIVPTDGEEEGAEGAVPAAE